MNRKWLVTIAVSVVLILVAIGVSGCTSDGAALAGDANLRVNVNSQQEGMAILKLGIEAQEASVSEAQAQAAEAMDKVMTALTDAGVAEKDIQTQYFNIQRVTRWDNDKQQEIVIGYKVSNMVTAKIRDITKAGVVIDSVATAGGDLTRIDSIGFTIDDPSAYYTEARQKAMADAEAKAKQLAELGGVKLGKPTYISESSYQPGPIYRGDTVATAEAAPSVETPISAGEMELTLNVQVTYSILD
jgi:uncharacterized protein YggE